MNRYQHACYLNAKSLLKASKLLFEKKWYGPATALAVLSIEECGKGFLFMIHNPEKDGEEWVQKQILPHRNKLLVAAKDAYMMGLKHEGFFSEKNPVKSLEEFQQKIEQLHREGNRKFLDLAYGSYFIQKLNPLKMRGLYVDLKDGEIISPKSVKRKDAEFAMKQAERLVRYFPKTYGRKVR